MPLVYQQNINESTRMAVWHIAEQENFFLQKVILQREITHPHKRLQHLAGRFLLKELYPDFPNELIKIADTKKPFLEDEKFHFSISHCGNYAAAVVSKHNRVGIDVELFSKKAVYVKNKFLSTEEDILIRNIINEQLLYTENQLYTLCWSIKECLYKWKGENGIDFIKDLHIRNIKMKIDDIGNSTCIIQRADSVSLIVKFILTNEFTLAWCVD